ncbi:formate dehydrogenase accessory sulfurtransferase FdhD [Chloroflexota bacterium]
MDNETENFPALRLTPEGGHEIQDKVAREFLATIFLNKHELATLLCSPSNLRYLAAGFLFSEGLLARKDDIKSIKVDDFKGTVRIETVGKPFPDSRLFSKRLITSGCGGNATFYSVGDAAVPKITSPQEISATEIFALVKIFQHGSPLYLETGGVHSAALCDRKNILVFSEDIGRHNAIDKIFGKCFLEDMPTNDRLILTSGRISSEIIHKIARRNIPIIISLSAPTSLGVKMAENLGITLVGHVRGKRMNVYTHRGRVLSL